MNIWDPLGRVRYVFTKLTRYVGRKFALQICIANGRKAFAIDDGRVNRKKSQKSLYNKIWALKSVCRYFSAPKSVRRFLNKKSS